MPRLTAAEEDQCEVRALSPPDAVEMLRPPLTDQRGATRLSRWVWRPLGYGLFQAALEL